MNRQWLVYMLSILCGLAPAAAHPQSVAPAPRSYAADLGTLYGERYSLQVLKDVCIFVQPKTRAELQKAYGGWLERNEDLIEDLDIRFQAMVKQVSRDENEFARVYGKYQGAVMSQRQVQKDELLALPRDELLGQCKELPGYLRSANSNIPARYPDEFKTVYGKK
ncbi:MAG: hypothetical protein Q8K18_05635 [Burkholderiales bacterium]|nr:hypothetical protein [Burkholderiales bacterium]